MNSPYRAHAANLIEFATHVSNTSDRVRLLALAEEDYCLTKQPSRANRWQHPLQRSIQVRRREA